MKMKKITLLLLLMATPCKADCFQQAAERYKVDSRLIRAVCKVESEGNSNAVNQDNSDGSIDYGLCQINSWWFPKLKKYGITKETLLNDQCTNIMVSAWILAQNFDTGGVNWNSVGAYNAGWKASKQKARNKYIIKVKKALNLTHAEDGK